MKRMLIILAMATVCFFSCETIYTPELETVEEMLVVEARLMHGQHNNQVRLYKTKSFNHPETAYQMVGGASVTLIDNYGENTMLTEVFRGTYNLDAPLLADREYQLHISVDNEVYSSTLQAVPKIPAIDTIYAEHTEALVNTGTDQAAGSLRKTPGAQIFVDIADNNDVYNYRFTGRKVCQYSYLTTIPMFGAPMEVTVFAWLSQTPQGLFNIASPPEYSASKDIRKHPLVFLERNYRVFKPDTQTYFNGWIYIFQQYAISNQTHQFYKDLNSQLAADGKLFDPLYIQARGNMSCLTDPRKKMLGNFEIASVREHRFFLTPVGNDEYYIKPIPYFWFIPASGASPDERPEWWEYRGKTYPENN